jgi:alpha-L-rhamnosidase
MKYIFTIAILFLWVREVHSQEHPHNAKWIWQAQAGPHNTWMTFRKSFSVREIPANATAKIAVDSKYWLWINGKMVVFEGGLKRGPNPKETYYDKVDLKPYLTKGKNTIAILVWYWGKEGHSHISSGKGGLLFDAQIGALPVLSDKTWKIKIHPGYDTVRTGLQPYRPMSEFNVIFDARKDIPGWNQTTYNDKTWANAVEKGQAGSKPWNNLVERPIPQWKDYGLKDYAGPIRNQAGMGSYLIATLPYNAQFTPYLKVIAPAGLMIDIRTDAYMDGGGENVRAEYVTKAGEQEFESYGWMSGHHVYYTIPYGVQVVALKYRETGFDTEFAGKFSCNDQFLNQLRQKCLRTLYINMRDNYMDPTRERAMWAGDFMIQSGQTYYAMDTRANTLNKKSILEFVNWQTADSILYSPIPGPHAPLPFGPYRELPLQSLASISELGFGTYFQQTGDTATMQAVYPHAKKYLGKWHIGSNGLVIHRAGKWDWADWGTDIDAPLLDNAWYYLALKEAIRMAKLSGKPSDTVLYTNQKKSIEANFNKIFWNGKEYRSPGYKGETDERGNAMAVLCGFADGGKWDQLETVLTKQVHASPYMEKFVLEALFVMHQPAKALARMKERYRGMVESKMTTLSELWDGGGINHGWSGGPLTLLSQYVAGIAPAKPGYTAYNVMPQLGGLDSVHAVAASVKGKIEVNIIKKAGAFELTLHSPKGSTATVGVPKDRAKTSVSINGSEVFKNGKNINNPSGIEYAGEDAYYYKFKVPEGSWQFLAN